jgi:predicted TIM-barrel fold metal-dependent hydrolase
MPAVDLPGGKQRPMSPLALAAALKHPDRFAILQRVERTDPQLPSLLEQLGSTPAFKSIRLTVRGKVERESLAGGGHDEVFRLAQKNGLAISLLGNRITPALKELLPRYPEARFVLDHCGQPESAEEWSEILTLGRTCANLWLKWAHGLHYFESGDYPYPGLQRQLARALDAFGLERVVWASDFTHNRAGSSWAELLFYLRDSEQFSSSDKEWLFSRAARTLYRWPAPAQAFVPPHVPLLPDRPLPPRIAT